MAIQNTPALKDRAWEIFVQLVGNGARPAAAVTEAFSAVQIFDNHSNHLKEAKRKSAKQDDPEPKDIPNRKPRMGKDDPGEFFGPVKK